MKTLLHYLYAIFGACILLLAIVPAIIVHFSFKYNLMAAIELELSYYERKYFDK